MDNALPIVKTPVLEASNLCFSYGEVELFQNLSFSLYQGEVRVILGPSGSGKTTLLHLLAGLLQLQQGEVRWQGQSIRTKEEDLARRRLHFCGLVFQHHYLQAELTALENVLVPGYLANRVDVAWGLELLRRIGLTCTPKPSPAANDSGSPWPGPSTTGPGCFWPTSLPVAWIGAMQRRFGNSCSVWPKTWAQQ